MQSLNKTLALPLKLMDYVDGYDKAVKQIDTLYRDHSRLDETCRQFGLYGAPPSCRMQNYKEHALKELLANFWRKAFNATGFMRYMDATAVDQFHDSLERNPPPFTADNIETTFISLASDAENLFRRGLWTLFRNLCGHYRTNPNTPFDIGKKIILSGFISNFISRSSNYNRWAQWNDLDRIFQVLDGKDHTPNRLVSALDLQLKTSATYEDEYFSIKTFANGNAHVTFKRLDLVAKANSEIVAYCAYNVENKEAAA